MKNITILCLFIYILILSSSCNNCNAPCQNGGICIDGTCECLDGYEGTSCEILSRDNLIGNYNVISNCDDGSTPTSNWGIIGSATAINDIMINNFHVPTLNVIAQVDPPSGFLIPPQAAEAQGIVYTLSGNGIIEDNGDLTISYMIESGFVAMPIRCTVKVTR